MKVGKIVIIVFTLLSLPNKVLPQQNVIYKGNFFKPSEVIEAQIGNTGETFSFMISEVDMGANGAWAKKINALSKQGKTYNPSDAPKPLSLHLSINFKKRFKFPITPEDSVYVNYSAIKEKSQEVAFNKNKAMEGSGLDNQKETQSLATKSKSVEEEARRISMLMQEGKMSPVEAMKKIGALSNNMQKEIDNSSVINKETDEFVENIPTFDIRFSNPKALIEAVPFKGRLYIKEFNSKRLEAYLQGEHYVECTDTVIVNDSSMPCENVETVLFPGQKVLKLENVGLTINTLLKTFYDNR